jgi:predicted NUDIX family NTP pyrophosphohydrolase
MVQLVKESLNEANKTMEKSAGLVIICNNKILLGHPTGSKWKGTYSIPKGHVENGESDLEAAIRETSEEIGITIKMSDISDEKGIIDYENNGKVYKQVYYFVAYLKTEPLISSWKLEKAEIDHAGFFNKEEAKSLIFKRFKPLLDYLK